MAALLQMLASPPNEILNIEVVDGVYNETEESDFEEVDS